MGILVPHPEVPPTEVHTAEVAMDGLLEVLGRNLYASPIVALRELIQNAHDSCVRRRLEHGVVEPRIELVADPVARTLTIRDNGSGLTRGEIVRYLATVGVGYTAALRQKTGDESLIGAFGLGFLSAFSVASQVEVLTTSASTPDQTWRYSSARGQRYLLEPAAPRPIGTVVTLHLKADMEALSLPRFVAKQAQAVCCLLPTPVFAPERVNDVRPPWERADFSELSTLHRRRLLQGFAGRFEPMFAPITSFSLEDGTAKGVIWLQDGSTYGNHDNRRVVLFVRGMLISLDARDLLPRWAGFVGAVVCCDDLTPTASREDVLRDARWEALQVAIRMQLITALTQLPWSGTADWRRVLSRHGEALRGAALVEPDLFAALVEHLPIPTSEGELPLPSVRQRHPRALLLATDPRNAPLTTVYRALGLPIIDGARYAVRPLVQQYCRQNHINLLVLGTEAADRTLFPAVSLEADQAAVLQGLFAAPDTQVIPSRFSPAALPAVRILDQDVLLKRRMQQDERDRTVGGGLLRLTEMFAARVEAEQAVRLVVNLDAPLIQALLAAPPEKQAQGASLVSAMTALLCRTSGGDDEAGRIEVRATLGALSEAAAGLLR